MNDRLHDNTETGLDLVGCPACAAPAEVVERYVLDSTDGPIEHATVLCSDRHRFTVLVERLRHPTRAANGGGAMGATLSCRDRAILRAVAGGGAELLGGRRARPVPGRPLLRRPVAAHRLARAGLIATAVPGAPGSRVAARLTAVGVDALALRWLGGLAARTG